MLFDLAADVPARKCGEAQVQHNGGGDFATKRLQRGLSVGTDLYGKLFSFEQALQRPLHRAVVLYYQNSFHSNVLWKGRTANLRQETSLLPLHPHVDAAMTLLTPILQIGNWLSLPRLRRMEGGGSGNDKYLTHLLLPHDTTVFAPT